MKAIKFVMITTFYPPYHLGGDALHVYNLSNELAKRGHEVHIVHSIDAYYLNRRKAPLGDYPNHERVFLHSLKSKLGIIAPLICGFLGSPFPLAGEALRLVKSISPDVVNHHNIIGFGPAVLDAKAPTVLYTAHGYWLICPRQSLLRPDKTFCDSRRNCSICCLRWKRPPQLWRLTDTLKKKLSNIDMIITPSEYMRTTLESAGISQPIVTIPNFVPEPSAVSEPMYGFPYFLYVGLLEEHKGILNLVEAFGQVKDETKAGLLIAGTGSLEDKLRRTIAQRGWQDRIRMLGWIDDKGTLANLYSNALALVIPSICPENAPLVALEALACGTPVITSDMGGLPEIADKTGQSLIFRNEPELRHTLVTISKQTKDRSRESKHVYSQLYSPDAFLAKYLGLIS